MSDLGVQPHTVGFLDEGLFADPAVFDRQVGDVMRLRFDQALDAGELDRPVELVVRTGRGLPYGSAKAVRDAWAQLADAGALVILGPGITDNCLAVVDTFEAGRVPTVNFPGTAHSRGRYGFHYQLGALYGDGPLIVRAMARQGYRRVGVLRDRSPIGDEYFEHFQEECERTGTAICVDRRCSPVATDLGEDVAVVGAAGPDALAYLGFGGILVDLSRALADAGWDPPRFTTTAGMHFYSKTPEERAAMSGWVYVDQVDEDNQAMRHFLDAFERRHGRRPFDPLSGAMVDLATLAVLGIHHAPVHTPQGVMEGLERISQIPAVLGGEGTVLGFGPWERTALKGPDYLVLRKMQGTVTVRWRG
jgi:branched-chain amino acid transport system substrate-binding protein